jgi:hypothetical protein
MSSCNLCRDFLVPDGRHFYGIDIPSLNSLWTSAQNGCRSCSLLLRGVGSCVPELAKDTGLSMLLWLQSLSGNSTFILQLRKIDEIVCSIEFFVTEGEFFSNSSRFFSSLVIGFRGYLWLVAIECAN